MESLVLEKIIHERNETIYILVTTHTNKNARNKQLIPATTNGLNLVLYQLHYLLKRTLSD